MTVDSQETHSTFQEFFRTEAAAGALLVGCAVAALVTANSGVGRRVQRCYGKRR